MKLLKLIKTHYLIWNRKHKNPYANKARTKFCMRLNNYKTAHKSFKTKARGTLKLFHEYYVQDDHDGKDYGQLAIMTNVLLMLN